MSKVQLLYAIAGSIAKVWELASVTSSKRRKLKLIGFIVILATSGTTSNAKILPKMSYQINTHANNVNNGTE